MKLRVCVCVESCKLFCIKIHLDKCNLVGLPVPVKHDQSFIFVLYSI
jgi:hypothetical protein